MRTLYLSIEAPDDLALAITSLVRGGGRFVRTSIITAAVCCALGSLASAGEATAAIRRATNIEPQALGTALKQFAESRDLQLLYFSEAVKNLRTAGAVGEITVDEALTRILAGTGLSFRYLGDKTITIFPESAPRDSSGVREDAQSSSVYEKSAREDVPWWRRVRIAQVSDDSASPGSRAGESIKRNDDVVELAEVVVTGSHIRGSSMSASPVQRIDREEFRAQGSASLQDALRDIPANFSGDFSGEGAGVGQGGGLSNNSYNRSRATAPNLHGLGAAATLSLLNGRRLPTASNGYSVDLSLIPLIALERVEVLADGASPVYGADAIAGVVNLIARRDESVVESRARYGTPTQSGFEQWQLGQALGTQWSSGAAFFAYQYDDQDALRSKQRKRSSNMTSNRYIMPDQTQHSAYVNAQQDVGSAVQLGFEGLYSRRDFEGETLVTGVPQAFDTSTDQFLGALTADVRLGDEWRLTAFGQYSGASAKPTIIGGANPSLLLDEDFKGTEFSTGATVSGPMVELLGRPVRAAVGGEYREEQRELTGFGDGVKPFDVTRQVRSAFLELQIPLADTLEISAAVRHDAYSDFGGTTNPKLGIAWTPLDGVRIRGTYSTSFRALSLKDMRGQTSAGLYRYVTDSTSPTGRSLALFVNGNPTASVRPEESDNYTFGIDFSPAALDGLSLGLTYFSVDYDNKLANPFQAVTNLNNLDLPDTQPYIVRNPSLSEVEAILASVNGVASFTGVPQTPDQVQVIIDNRYTNLSAAKVRGIDLDARWIFPALGGDLTLSNRSTIGLDHLTAVSEDAPEVERVGTSFFPPKFRSRLGVSARWSVMRAGLTVDYVSAFKDKRYVPTTDVASWTTVDFNVGASFANWSGALAGVEAEFVVRNLLDQDPPYVRPYASAPGDYPVYDPTNASVVGRMLSLQLTKSWR